MTDLSNLFPSTIVPTPVSYSITNPGGETNDMTGWTADDGTGFEIRSADPTAHGGSYYFYGGANAVSSSYQDIVLVTGDITAAIIDSGSLLLEINYWASSYNYSDETAMYIEFLDSDDASMTPDYEPIVGSPGPTLSWEERKTYQIAPSGARKARLYMYAYRQDGTGNNAHIDDIALSGLVLV